jgi:hypothetical protein
MALWKKKVNGWPPDGSQKRIILGHDIDKYGYLLPQTTIYGNKDPMTDKVLNYLSTKGNEKSIGGFDLYKYDAIWRTYNKFGNQVKINPVFTPESYINSRGDQGIIPHFDRDKNTINFPYNKTGYDGVGTIASYLPQDIFFEELAHAQQWKNPVKANLKFIWDNLRIPSNQKNGDYDKNMYDNPSTIEYEAHKVISPKIREYYSNIVDRDYNKPENIAIRKKEQEQSDIENKQYELEHPEVVAERNAFIKKVEMEEEGRLYRPKLRYIKRRKIK